MITDDTDILEQSLKKAFINKDIVPSHLDPKLLVNDESKQLYMMTTLQEELASCRDFFISVAFLTQSGLNVIKAQLADLEKKGIYGRLMTSDYLDFNNPDVFENLLKISNLEVRISQKSGFHVKGYLFDHEDYQSFIIGSSNLTMNALKINYEWNVRLTSRDNGEMLHDIQEQLNEEWEASEPLTPAWIQNYRETYAPQVIEKQSSTFITDLSEEYEHYGDISPNKMQKEALLGLRKLRDEGKDKGLLVSATGTGKTYLSAFDVKQLQPKKMLFICHREQILRKAMSDYQKVLGGLDSDFGLLTGNRKDLQAKYLFATIQTVSKTKFLDVFPEGFFDYILIDEVHKAGAKTYQKVLDYFHPQFLLGMTATPERTDNFNIFELFDYNIAYEIRLQEAMEEDLLCPFHYFGVTDYEKNGQIIEETTDLQYLTYDERVKFLIQRIDYYGCSHNLPKGLVFCSRKDEAKILAEKFTSLGRPSAYLSGDHPLEERESQVQRLENGEIEYIFTVDIFNEGIDIPKINQVVMLRNTESNIIFIQQLGRGLRKDNSKEFVTVIDFIGNYKNNYMIPMALSGDVSRNKSNLRKDTYATHYISGVSSVNFEAVAKERVFASIDKAKLDSMAELRNAYKQLKNRLGRVPYLKDFAEQQTLDPLIIADKFDNYYTFLKKIGENEEELSNQESDYLKFFTRELLPGIRKQELVLLQTLLSSVPELARENMKHLFESKGLLDSDLIVNSVLRILDTTFYTGQEAKTYKNCAFVDCIEDKVRLSQGLKQACNNGYFKWMLQDNLDTAEILSQKYSQEPLTLYQKYQRKDVLRLLNWSEQMVNQNIGGYTRDDGLRQYVIFVTLDKGNDFQGAQVAYEDAFVDSSTFQWFSKSKRNL